MVKKFAWLLVFLAGCSQSPSETQTQSLESLKEFKGFAILTSDYVAPAQIHFWDGSLRTGSIPVHRDSKLRWDAASRSLRAIQRLEGDSYRVIPLDNPSAATELSLFRGKNLQDVLSFPGDKAWVTAYNSNSVAQVDLKTGQTLQELGIDAAPDSDGYSEPTHIFRAGNWLVTTFQRLTYFSAENESFLMKWSLSGEEKYLVPLRLRNPVTEVKKYQDTYWVGSAGVLDSGKKLDGGIEELNPDFGPARVVILEAQLGGDIVDFEIINDDLAVAIVSRPQSAVVAFHPVSGQVIQTLPKIEAPGYQFAQVYWWKEKGRLLLADQDKTNPRIRMFDENLAELENEQIKLPFPPVQMLRIE